MTLDLREPEFTEEQLRAAHEHLRIKCTFEAWMRAPWGPGLLRCCARAMARRAAKAH